MIEPIIPLSTGFLKKKGLVTHLEAYPFTSAPGIHQYVIECDLTHEGVKQHQLGECNQGPQWHISTYHLSDSYNGPAHLPFSVASTVYAYIKLLKSQPFPSWVFKELRQILHIDFRFLENPVSVARAAMDTSVSLHERSSRARVFSEHYSLTDDGAESVKHALSFLVPDKVQVIVASPVQIEGLSYNEREQWYGTEYDITQLKRDWFEVGSRSV